MLCAHFGHALAYLIPPGPPDIGLANATTVLKMLLIGFLDLVEDLRMSMAVPM